MSRAYRHGFRLRAGGITAGFEPLESRQLLASFLVTTANDAGIGSLRQAILDANASGAASTIDFAIPGSGLHKIEVASDLPTIVVPLAIDARTQPGYAGTPLIELDGSDATASNPSEGFYFDSGSTGSSVEGLEIVRFVGVAIEVFDQNGLTIQASDIGYDPSGGTPSPGNGTGIMVQESSNLTIGGPTTADGNIIDSSANISGENLGDDYGTAISLSGSNRVTIQDNIIGTDPTQTADLGNAYDGIDVGYGTNISIVSNTIANSGYEAIGNNDDGSGNTLANNVLINNGSNIATLSQTSTTAPSSIAEGQTETITYTITNNGPHAATNVEFVLEDGDTYAAMFGDPIDNIPVYGNRAAPIYSIKSVTPSQGMVTTNDNSTSVALGTLANGGSATVTVVVNGLSAGTGYLASVATSDQFTLSSYYALALTTPVQITGSPDLGVVALPPIGTAKLGVPFTFQFLVTNHDTMGLIEADYAVINGLKPSSILDSVTAPGGQDFGILGPYTSSNSNLAAGYSYYDGGDLGDLAAGASVIVSVTLTPTQLGPLVVEFATSPASFHSSPDINPANNLAYAGVPVLLSPSATKTTLNPAKGNIQSVEVFFDAPLVAGSANDVHDYNLTTTASATDKPATIAIRSAHYDPKTRSVTLTLGHSLTRKGTPLRLALSGLSGTDGSKLPATTRNITIGR